MKTVLDRTVQNTLTQNQYRKGGMNSCRKSELYDNYIYMLTVHTGVDCNKNIRKFSLLEGVAAKVRLIHDCTILLITFNI